MRGVKIQVDAHLVTETCCRSDCGILFAVPVDWQTRKRSDHSNFYCPNGHDQHYTGQTEAEKLREQLVAEQARSKRERERARAAEESAMNLANSRRALRGVVTKLKNKAAAGTCAWCDHAVPDLAAHVAAEHPGVSVEADDADESLT